MLTFDNSDSHLLSIQRAYKTELDPNRIQTEHFLKACGTARFAYNWALERKEAAFKKHNLNRSVLSIKNELNRVKSKDFPWMYEVSKCVPEEALWDLDDAYKNFFSKRAKRPSFKSRMDGIGSFRIEGSKVRVYADQVQLPKLGLVRLKERGYIPWEDVKVLSVTISERAGCWFISVNVEQNIEIPTNDGPVDGVDLGIKNLAVISDGTVIPNPQSLHRNERKLKRLQRSVSRKQRGSNNRCKAVQKLARVHFRTSNIRKDALNKATTMLTKTKSLIVIEDLAVANMLGCRLAKSLSDASLSEFRRQLEYKANWYGSKVVVADRYYPSTKRCSHCGSVKESMTLSERVYECQSCGFMADRDFNAALNLKAVAVGFTDTLNACQRPEVQAARPVPVDEAGNECVVTNAYNRRTGDVGNG